MNTPEIPEAAMLRDLKRLADAFAIGQNRGGIFQEDIADASLGFTAAIDTIERLQAEVDRRRWGEWRRQFADLWRLRECPV